MFNFGRLPSERSTDKNISLVRRIPPVKTFRTHSLGLTLAFVSVLTAITFQYVVNSVSISWAIPVASLFFFALLTYNFDYLVRQIFSAILLFDWLTLVIAAAAIALLIWVLSLIPATGLAASLLVLWSQYGFLFVATYVCGILFAYLYNTLVYFFVLTFQHQKVKIAFAYDKTKSLNMIKSPAEREEIAFLKIVQPLKYLIEKIRHGANSGAHVDALVTLIKEAWHKMHKRDREHLLIFAGLCRDDCWDNLEKRIRKQLENDKDATLTLLERDFEPLVERYLNLKENKLYNYEIKYEPPQPFTIAFVANPMLLKQKDGIEITGELEADPIMKDPELFYRTVDRALRALEKNEVFGRPEIWSRVRVLTWFKADDDDATGGGTEIPEINLVQELGPVILVNGERIVTNVLTPVREMTDRFETEMLIPGLEQHEQLREAIEVTFPQLSLDGDPPVLPEVDVIIALSASRTHTRPSARYSNYLESPDTEPLQQHEDREFAKPPCSEPCECRPDNPNGFYFNPDPHGTKMRRNDNGNFETEYEPYVILTDDGAGKFNEELYDPENLAHKQFAHEPFTRHPGRIAVNALEATGRTFVHELAHAISSPQNGIIMDEYIDRLDVIDDDALEDPKCRKNPPTHASPKRRPIFYINRLERKRTQDHTVAPVHQIFGNYNCVDYRSDLYSPSAEENWNAYFPEREDVNVACTMDRAYGAYRFDKLLSRFLYDLMIAKVNR